MSDRVLVDTSAWLEFFRHPGSPVAALVDRLLEDDLVASAGVVRAELLQGARSAADFDRLGVLLSALPDLGSPADAWLSIARLGFRLRRGGANGIGLPDLWVAVTAIESDAEVLTLDAHFDAIALVSPLRLFTGRT